MLASAREVGTGPDLRHIRMRSVWKALAGKFEVKTMSVTLLAMGCLAA